MPDAPRATDCIPRYQGGRRGPRYSSVSYSESFNLAANLSSTPFTSGRTTALSKSNSPSPSTPRVMGSMPPRVCGILSSFTVAFFPGTSTRPTTVSCFCAATAVSAEVAPAASCLAPVASTALIAATAEPWLAPVPSPATASPLRPPSANASGVEPAAASVLRSCALLAAVAACAPLPSAADAPDAPIDALAPRILATGSRFLLVASRDCVGAGRACRIRRQAAALAASEGAAVAADDSPELAPGVGA